MGSEKTPGILNRPDTPHLPEPTGPAPHHTTRQPPGSHAAHGGREAASARAFWLSLCLQRLLPVWLPDPAPCQRPGKAGRDGPSATPVGDLQEAPAIPGANQLMEDFLSARSLSLSL